MVASVFKEKQVQKIPTALIQRMEDIVTQVVVVAKFRSDFYMNDVKTMTTCSIFAWYVYDCGTHLIPLNDMTAVQTFQHEWLSNMEDLKGSKKAKETDRLYVCNVNSGELKRVYSFDELNLIEQLKAVN
jgi:hypothetical protein